MSEKEEYLDELLKEVDGDSKKEEGQTTEEGNLDNYDKELEGIDEDDFLREFEKSLGDNQDADMEKEFSQDMQEEDDWEKEFNFENDITSEDFMDNIDSIVNDVNSSTLDDGLGEGDLSIEESLKNFENEDPDLDEIGQEFGNEDFYEAGVADELTGGDTVEQPEELSESERLAREIEGLNLEPEEPEAEKRSFEQEQQEESKTETLEGDSEKVKKPGFFARLSRALFGEEDESVSGKAGSAKSGDIENLSEEELAALIELENQNAAAAQAEEEKKKQEQEEKKALKEQKEKEKAEKKAEKKALKEQKAKEKAEKKALKLQNQEPVEKSKPLPKKPVVLIVLFGLSIVVLVNLLSGMVGYNTALSDAEDYYARGEYVEAYGCLNEKDMKKADVEFYNRVRLTSYLQQQINSYDAYQSRNMYNEALSALVCGVGRYDRFAAEAAGAGVDREYEKMLQKIEEELSSKYQMSLEEARTLYALEDKQEFTYAVYDVTEALGLTEEP